MTFVHKFLVSSLFLILSYQFAYGQCNRNTRIGISGGHASIELCAGDVDNSSIVISTNNRGTQYAYVLTDENDNFVRSGTRSRLDIASYPPGVYRVYGLSYSGSLRRPVGQNIFDARLSGGCHELSSNFITISLVDLEAGQISTTSGQQDINICSGDGISDVVNFSNTSNDTEEYRYIITDEEGNILMITSNPFVDFENAPEGKCRVYGLSGSGSLLVQVGDQILASDLTDGCEDLTDNYVSVNRIRVDGGEVATSNGEDVVYVCPNNASADLVQFQNSGSTSHRYRYIVTDDTGTIIGLPQSEEVDFNEAPPGVCRVYGVSFTGNFIAMEGGSITDAVSTECFGISTNYITIYREDPMAGSVRLITNDTVVFTCPGDAIEDLIDLRILGGSNSALGYVITDEQDTILAVANELPINLTNAPEGICHIYVVAYTGELNASTGEEIFDAIFSEDCFDVSDDYLEVRRARPIGGAISLPDGMTAIELCVGDDISDLLFFQNTSSSLAPYRYVITDANNIIVGLPGRNFADFDRAGDGVCRIWGLSFIGTFMGQIGDNMDDIDLSDDCNEISNNYIEVTRLLMDAGVVLTDQGESVVYTCPGDDVDDIIHYRSSSMTSADITYIITNDENSVLAISTETSMNFDNVGQGVCRIWAIAHTGNIVLSGGQNVTTAVLSDGCAALSTSFLEVHRSRAMVGDIATMDGETQVLICNGSSSSSILNFEVSDRSDADIRYIITDDLNNILDIITDTQVDFSNAPNGTCRIYALSFTSSLDWTPGDNIDEVIPTEDCYDLSDNYIEVVRNGVDGGLVMTESGMTQVRICPDNGIANLIEFVNTGTSLGNYGYIITDENNMVLDLPNSNEVDFEGASIGTCRLWGVSYTGDISIVTGQNVILDPITNGCFDLSSNFVTVQRDHPNWNEFTTRNGEVEVDVTVGDGIPSIISFTRDGLTFGLSALVITDESGTILGVSNGMAVDFEGAGVGICSVYGLAYTGDLLAADGMNINDVLSSDCYSLSDNAVAVNRSAQLTIPDQPSLFKSVKEETVLIQYSHQSRIARIMIDDPHYSMGEVYVHSIKGELIWIESSKSNYVEIDFNLMNIPHGIYIVTYRSDQVIESRKLFID